jgi:hypothetical protein
MGHNGKGERAFERVEAGRVVCGVQRRHGVAVFVGRLEIGSSSISVAVLIEMGIKL